MSTTVASNPLGSESVTKLMLKFSIPSIISMLVGALYNIVDQLFIGQAVGMLGNAATNVAFPLSTSCIALALLFGIGGAACFNLKMGAGEKEDAAYAFGNAFSMLVISGVLLAAVSLIFLNPLLRLFGAPDNVMPYAEEYVRITAFGFPLLIITAGGGHLIRADGSPTMTMVCNLAGAIINTILDAIFVLQLDTLTIDTLPELEGKLPVKSNSLVIAYIRRVLESKDRPAHVQRLLADFEITADKDLAISKTLTKMGPMLGLMGTLIPMGPALVGLSTGDIASMAYNMQVAFATTVVGLFSSAIGFITQQVKQRWYLQDMTNLEFLSELLTEKRTA